MVTYIFNKSLTLMNLIADLLMYKLGSGTRDFHIRRVGAQVAVIGKIGGTKGDRNPLPVVRVRLSKGHIGCCGTYTIDLELKGGDWAV